MNKLLAVACVCHFNEFQPNSTEFSVETVHQMEYTDFFVRFVCIRKVNTAWRMRKIMASDEYSESEQINQVIYSCQVALFSLFWFSYADRTIIILFVWNGIHHSMIWHVEPLFKNSWFKLRDIYLLIKNRWIASTNKNSLRFHVTAVLYTSECLTLFFSTPGRI